GPTFVRWLQTQMEGCGVSYARMRLLKTLHCGGPQIMSGLSDELGVTPRNVTALVDALEDERLVQRKAHPTDRRATLIELTSAGSDLVHSLFNQHQEKIADLFRVLSETDRKALIRLLGRLQTALEERKSDA